jgi:hypothetical protein
VDIAKRAGVSPPTVTGIINEFVVAYMAVKNKAGFEKKIILKFSNPDDMTGISEQDFSALIPVAERYMHAIDERKIKRPDDKNDDKRAGHEAVVRPEEATEIVPPPIAPRTASYGYARYRPSPDSYANRPSVPIPSIYEASAMRQPSTVYVDPVQTTMLSDPVYRMMLMEDMIDERRQRREERRANRSWRQQMLMQMFQTMPARWATNPHLMTQYGSMGLPSVNSEVVDKDSKVNRERSAGGTGGASGDYVNTLAEESKNVPLENTPNTSNEIVSKCSSAMEESDSHSKDYLEPLEWIKDLAINTGETRDSANLKIFETEVDAKVMRLNRDLEDVAERDLQWWQRQRQARREIYEEARELVSSLLEGAKKVLEGPA